MLVQSVKDLSKAQRRGPSFRELRKIVSKDLSWMLNEEGSLRRKAMVDVQMHVEMPVKYRTTALWNVW